MSSALRRLLLAIAAVVFFILTTFVLALAAGYDLDGWRIVRRAGLIVDSRPKSQVILDGQFVGTTPYRSSRLDPGSVSITLRRTGYEPWSTTVDVSTGFSTPVSVIRLFPVVTPKVIAPIGEQATVLHDHGNDAVWLVTTDGTQATATGYGPTAIPRLTLPFRPTTIRSTAAGDHVYADDGVSAAIIDRAGTIWSIASLSEPAWLENGSTTLIGYRDGFLRSLDPLDRSLSIGPAATSYALHDDAIWHTTQVESVTTLWRQTTLSAAPSAAVTLSGVWTIQDDHGNQLIIRQPSDGSTRRVTGNRVTGWKTAPIDDAQRILSVSGTPLTWTNGLDIRLLLAANRTILLDRLQRGVRWAGWYHVATTVAVTDGHEVNIYGRYSTRPFQRMYTKTLPADAVFIGPLPRGEGFWYTSAGQLYSWSWRS